MSANITIKQQKSPQTYNNVEKIRTNTIDGTCNWVLENEAVNYASLKELSVRENGHYSAAEEETDGFSKVTVDVGYDLETLSVSKNGTYAPEDSQGFSSVSVNVSGGDGAKLISKSVTQNGTYSAKKDNADGYSSVTVNVKGGGESGDYYYPWTQEDDLPFSFSGIAVKYDGITLLQGAVMYELDGTQKSIMPASADCAVAYGNGLHIFNGTKHYEYDGKEWKQISTIPYSVSGSNVIVYKDKLHLLGGTGDARHTKHYAWDGSDWNEVSTLPYEFGNGGAEVFGGFLHIMGSSNSDSKKKHYKFNGSSWAEESTITYDFSSGSSVMYDGIHLLGGSGGSTYHYMYKGQFWHIQELIPIGYTGRFRAVRHDGKIHIFSGTSHYSTTKVTAKSGSTTSKS